MSYRKPTTFHLLVICFLCLVCTTIPHTGNAQSSHFLPNDLIVVVDSNSSSIANVKRGLGKDGGVVHFQREIGVLRVRTKSSSDFSAVVKQLRRTKGVLSVERNAIRRMCSDPNDTYYSSQYAPQLIKANNAWDIYNPKSTVVVAVLDTGVDYNHSDLSNAILRDSGGNPISYNALDGTANASDDNGHGTSVAGVASASINNGTGIAGIAGWNPAVPNSTSFVKVMPVKVLDAYGTGDDYGVSNGIIWAVNHGANVINLSLGSSDYTAALDSAIQYAISHGVVVAAAAGNSGSSALFYPAAYNNVISVAASDETDNITPWSNFGDWVKVLAPGNGVLSTWPGQSYQLQWGTSIATPHVTGVAAMIKAMYPQLSASQVSDLVTHNTDGYIPYYNHVISTLGGRLNAAKALQAAITLNPVPGAPTSLTAVSANHGASLNWHAALGASTYDVYRSTNATTGFSQVASNVLTTSYSDTGITNGTTYYYYVAGSNSGGEGAGSNAVSVVPVDPATLPTVPTGISVTNMNTSVLLLWSSSSRAGGYSVERSTVSGGPYTTVATNLGGPGMQDIHLVNGTTYYYRIYATNSYGSSQASVEVSGRPVAASPPATPTGLVVTTGDKYCLLSWNNVSGATSFTVKRSLSATGPFTVVGSNVQGAMFQDVLLTNGVTYYYVVDSANSSGLSADSAVASGTPH